MQSVFSYSPTGTSTSRDLRLHIGWPAYKYYRAPSQQTVLNTKEHVAIHMRDRLSIAFPLSPPLSLAAMNYDGRLPIHLLQARDANG